MAVRIAAFLSIAWAGWFVSWAHAGDLLRPASDRFSKASEIDEVPDFQRHVVPLIGRLGCNGRACHGSFQGRGGMALSLFGYDFDMDLTALTGKSQSEPVNRIDRESAANSLILQKASNSIEHEGGRRLAKDSWQHVLLARWISGGAKGADSMRSLVSLETSPAQINLSIGGEDSIQVVATWSDGIREDVTCLSRFRTNDDAVASVTADGKVTGVGHGDSHLIAFYDNGVAAVPAIVARSQKVHVDWPDDPPPTMIDQLVNDRLRTLGLVPSVRCDDAEFIRRASIDLTGTLPHPDEVRAFLLDDSTAKRQRKIDQLLRRPAMAAWWANKLCDFTGCNPGQQAELGQELARQWYMWIYARLRENTPYDQIVERIMLASGRSEGQSYEDYAAMTSAYFREHAAADFSKRATMPHYWSRRSLEKPSAKALAVAHSFLGIRLQCAECHKHPWDQWTQHDFRQFSEFFQDVRFGVAADAENDYRQLASRVGLRLRKDQVGAALRPEHLAKAREGQTIPWREVYIEPGSERGTLSLLRARNIQVRSGEDPRRHIMDWMRDPENPFFARAIVNRVWASCFHVGIVDPPDDLNAANPPSNAPLFDWLSAEFVRQGYDLRWLLCEITRSSTWQRSYRPNATNANDRRNFSRAIPRRLPAEVVYDAIKQVLCSSDQQQAVREDLSRRTVGHLSMTMAGTYAMHVFGKPERAVTCDCERVDQPSLLQSVFMQNDPLIHLLIDDSGWLSEIGKHDNPNQQQLREWIGDAWLRAYSRMPGKTETARALEHLRSAESTAEGMEDLLWSLLNTKEFLLNH